MPFGSFDSGSGPAQPMAEINTTPLVDVMLVLLVIFIITAPLFNQSILIDLPKVSNKLLEEKPRVIRLAVDGAGQASVDGAAVAAADLEGRLRQLAAGQAAPELQLRADRATRYERVAALLAAAQKAGIERIAFVTEPN